MTFALVLLLLAADPAAPAAPVASAAPTGPVGPAPAEATLPPPPDALAPPPPGVYPCAIAEQRRAEVTRKTAGTILGDEHGRKRVACPAGSKPGAARCDLVTYHCAYPIGRSGHWFTKSLNVTFDAAGRVVGWR